MIRCLNCMEEYEEENPLCPCCGWKGTHEEDPRLLEPGSILQGRYILGTARRKDAADNVYIGWDALFARKVLIMEYYPASCALRDPEETARVCASDEEAFREGLEIFLEDNENLILLDDTRGLLNVFSVFQENGTAYVTMEYPGGTTLREALLRDGTWSLDQVERLIRVVTTPVSAAHAMYFCHGQLSLDCCYQTGEGKYKVGCFNEAGYLTGDAPGAGGKKKKLPGPERDVSCLAGMVGAALLGVDLWENRPFEDNMKELAERTPEYVTDALRGACGKGGGTPLKSMRRFLDLFVDEATVEILPATVQKKAGDGKLDKRSKESRKRFF